ncbi:integrin beta-1-B-like [Amphiura filiformis]|uniref:integrin beta-1-B-like n=1 Tax=Amphiura filiformis TaxID=82378 RepID=UPI003B216977
MNRDHLVLFLLVFILHVALSSCQNQTSCNVARNCKECLTRDPVCAWCTDDVFNIRCDLEDKLITSGCLNISNPRSSSEVIKDEPLGDANTSPVNKTIQVQPQIIKLRLRKGETQKITIYVRPAVDYPLDLYYLMDLSKSMEDDLRSLRTIGSVLIRELQKLSSDVQLGFGSFVDKETLPYVYTDEKLLQLFCNYPPDNRKFTCAPAYGVRNSLNLTTDLDRFREEIEQVSYSTSGTEPEGGMDALMQIVVCKDLIGWRDTARHLLVYTSDNDVHVAGDGRLGAIYAPNDGLCHLDPVTNEYSETVKQDFPSIGQLNSKITDNNIYTIFAVEKNYKQFYKSMANYITGAAVGTLAADSSNIIHIIKEQYNAITSKVELIDSAPEGINIAYTAHCGEGDNRPGEKICTGLSVGQVVSFDLDITATSCEGDVDRGNILKAKFAEMFHNVADRMPNLETEIETNSFYVKAYGMKAAAALVFVDVVCSCDCEEKGIPNSDLCSDGNGTFACGVCYCNPNRYGEECECDIESGTGEGFENCRASDSTLICSGRGGCYCGKCQCFERPNPLDVISGPFCQCDNFSCDKYKGEICGGSKRGKCVCDENTWTSKCNCRKGYAGNACQCPDTNDACMATTGLLCNGFGKCDCGKCVCDEHSSFRGPTCEDCGICIGDCGVFRECVMCTVFEEGLFSPEECAQCSMLIVVEKKLHLRN